MIPNLEMKIYQGDNYELKSIEGTIKLNAWIGYQSRQGAYGSVDNKEKSDGTVKITVGSDPAIDSPEVTQEHINAYNYLINTKRQSEIQFSLLFWLSIKIYRNNTGLILKMQLLLCRTLTI